MATLTIKSKAVSSSKYDEFSSSNYKGAKKTDVAKTILLSVPSTPTHTVIVIPMVSGAAAKARTVVPNLKGLGYDFLSASADNIKWGRDIQYFGKSAFID